MKRTVLVGVVLGLLLAAAAPAIGQDIRDRLTFTGVGDNGEIVTGVVVDDFPSDEFTVSAAWTEPCTDADGVERSIRTLTNLTVTVDISVDVPQLLKSVEASGSGTQFVTVINECAPSISTTPVEGVEATLSGIRTSKVQNHGNATFTATGTGILTVGEITAAVAIDFTRRPLP